MAGGAEHSDPGGGGRKGRQSAQTQGVDVPQTPRQYTLTNKVTEMHGKPIYAVAFNDLDSRHSNVVATCGANRAHVYEMEPSPGTGVRLLQAYADDDEDESFYTLAWSMDETTGAPLLVVGGEQGAVKVIDCATGQCLVSLVGHGHAVNEIRVHALAPSVIYSASKDESVRVWDVRTGCCVLVLAGAGGHCNEVLSCDVHPSGTRLASCGMDNTICLWDLERHRKRFEAAAVWEDIPSKFKTRFVPYADYSTNLVHTNYVDCVRWLGDCLLTKSVNSKVVLWKPKFTPPKEVTPPPWMAEAEGLVNKVPQLPVGMGGAELIHEYKFADSNIWFMRFGVDFETSTMAVGNVEGKVFVWDLRDSPPRRPVVLTLPKCNKPVRMAAVTAGGQTVLACCDNGCLWRYDGQ